MINFAPMVLNVLAVKVNSMDRLSEINMGPTQLTDIFLSTKRNQGFGEDNGDFTMNLLPQNIILDQDVIDSAGNKGSVV